MECHEVLTSERHRNLQPDSASRRVMPHAQISTGQRRPTLGQKCFPYTLHLPSSGLCVYESVMSTSVWQLQQSLPRPKAPIFFASSIKDLQVSPLFHFPLLMVKMVAVLYLHTGHIDDESLSPSRSTLLM